MTRRDGGDRVPQLLFAALALVAAYVLSDALFGDRALVGLHTGSLSPWRATAAGEAASADGRPVLPLLADKTIQFEPLLGESLERLGAGQAPLWNPLNLGGVPLLAQGFQGVFHPPNWLAALMPHADAFGWIAWLQALLAGGFAALLARELGCAGPAAFLAGTSWMLCGYLSARWHWYQISGCSVWLPLALWGVERLTRAGSDAGRRTLAVTGLAVGLAWLSGWFQGALHLVYVSGAWGLVRLAPRWMTGGDERRDATRALLRCGAAVALGMALAAPQVAPTLAWVASGESARDVETPEAVAGLGMEPAGLLGLLSTDNLGHPVDVASHPLPQLQGSGALMRWAHKANGNYIETSSSIGVVALVLALLGASVAARGRGLALALVIAGLLLSLESPLLLAVARLPGLASGDPRRFLLLSSMGLTLLAALGLNALLSGAGRPTAGAEAVGAVDPNHPRTLRLGLGALLFGAAALAGAWLVSSLSADAFASAIGPGLAERTGLPQGEILARAEELTFDRDLLARLLGKAGALVVLTGGALLLARRAPLFTVGVLLGLACFEQIDAGAKNAVSVPRAHLFEPPPRAADLASPSAGRLMPFHRGGVSDPLGGPLPGNVNMGSGIDVMSGYWALAPRRIVDVLEGLQPGSTFGLGTAGLSDEALLSSAVLDLLDVGLILASEPLTAAGLEPLGAVGDAWLYRRPSHLGRAWFSAAKPVRDRDAALAAVLEARGDVRASTPLSPIDGRQPPAHAPVPSHAEVDVAVDSTTPEHVTLTVDAPALGVVVLAQTFHPNWEATVDGAPATVWPAWHALTAVEVGPGAHTVALTYVDRPFKLAVWSSLAALAILATLLTLPKKRRTV